MDEYRLKIIEGRVLSEKEKWAREQQVRDNQSSFLKAYAIVGTIRGACSSAGIANRRTVQRWVEADQYGFRERFEDTKHIFREKLEEIAFQRLEQQKPESNPVLLITMLNAHHPEKYRPQSQPVNEEARTTLLEMRREFARLPEHTEEETAELTIDQQIDKTIKDKQNEE